MLAFFPKPNGDAVKCEQHREIVLSDVSGKAYHRCKRKRLEPCLAIHGRPSQMAGINGRGTDFGCMAVRTYIERFEIAGLSYACIFIDITAAFYNLRRRFLVDGTLNLNEAGHYFIRAAASRMGANLHDTALTAMTLHAAWFTIQHSDVCNNYTKGVLPGDPEADI
eukprot:171751-Lingulodinium_polyedra.AAC.1